MKKSSLRLTSLTLIPIALLAFVSCAKPSGVEDVEVVDIPGGVAEVDTFTTSGIVTAIDFDSRKVSLTLETGKKIKITAGPDVVNFDQLEIDDEINVQVSEVEAIVLGSAELPSSAGASAGALAPLGAKPGAMLGDTEQVTGMVTEINAKHHKVTLAMPDGTSEVIKVNRSIDLTGLEIGDTITMIVAEVVVVIVD